MYLRLHNQIKMTQNQLILIIGNNLGRLKNLSSTLQRNGFNVLYAADGREGFRLIRRESPDLVISEANLSLVSGVKLCRMVRADRELWITPMIFLSGLQQDSLEILRAGANDCWNEIPDSQCLAAKIQWLIERKNSEMRSRQYYKILSCRQTHINQIIKGTADILAMSKFTTEVAGSDEIFARESGQNLSRSLESGINMVSALANLLNEQTAAFENWERLRRGEDFADYRSFQNEAGASNYECMTYDLIDNDLPAN